MSHRPITEDDLHGYVDQLLGPERRTEVAAYLDAHPDVARRVATFSGQRDLLRSALAPTADEPLPPELNLSRIIEARNQRPTRLRWAVAAMLLLSVGSLGGWVPRGLMLAASSGVPRLAQEGADPFNGYAPDRGRPGRGRPAEWRQPGQRVSHPVH